MFGRQVSSSLLRLPIYARLPLRTAASHSPRDLLSRALFNAFQRSYATPSRPKKAVGEPSKPVKRSVKRAAKKPASHDGAGEAERRMRAKRTNAAKKKSQALSEDKNCLGDLEESGAHIFLDSSEAEGRYLCVGRDMPGPADLFSEEPFLAILQQHVRKEVGQYFSL